MGFVVFRADASADIGGGHVYRCLTLAAELVKSLSKMPSKIHFICREETGHLAKLIEQNGFTVSMLPATLPFNQTQDASLCREVLYQLDEMISWVIIDHYQLDTQWEAMISAQTPQLAVIDDLANRPHHCDLLFDQSLGRVTEHYQPWLTPRCKTIIVGATHALLRPQFIAARQTAQNTRANTQIIGSILIAMGATDPGNATQTVLEQLTVTFGKQAPTIHIVLAGIAKHLGQVKSQIKNRVANSPLDVKLHIDVTDMAGLLLQCDMAVAAAGTSLLERCCLGLPTVLVCLADNQAHIAKAAEASQSVIAVLDQSQLTTKLGGIVKDFIKHSLNDMGNYQALAKRAFDTCNGSGAAYLTSQLQQHSQTRSPLYLQAVDAGDMDLLYQWQLAPKTRQYSRHPEPPTLQQHQLWFSRVMNNKDILFYLLKQGQQSCGYIRLDNKTVDDINGYEVSIALAPNCYGKGLGHQALLLTQQLYCNDSLLAYIEPQNQPSLKAFAKASFLPLNNDWYFWASSA
ncbi:MAG: UDP-2,4-diacetamido-2,4,6-trideoxy-beta-L-altropyranose hydrolase [Alteromonadaceae bacterium]|jgi:UDP-2,4-diacetamido-2,4,6-trideoxy-beta-L-altropyranose hydrolase